MHFRRAAWLLLASCASAAYVQQQPCDGASANSTSASISTEAGVQHVNRTHDRIFLSFRDEVDDEQCTQWAKDALITTFKVSMLGWSSLLLPDVNVTCHLGQGSGNANANGKGNGDGNANGNASSSYVERRMAVDTDAFPDLTTFHVVARVLDTVSQQERCLKASITPELSPATQTALRAVPLTLFGFVCLVGVLRTAFERHAHDPSGADEMDQHGTATPRMAFPNVGDCLQYLQFIFLTGSLTLAYPGFYQPTVAPLNWFGLLTGGYTTHGYTPSSARDGVYEVNGTYGSTYGLSLMTQAVGAPPDGDVWINMLVTTAILATLAFLALRLPGFIARRRDEQTHHHHHHHHHQHHPAPAAAGPKETLYQMLRIVVPYFGLPILAISFFQLLNAASRPVYLTLPAAILISAALAAFAWLLVANPRRSAGVLVFDSSKRYVYRLLSSSEGSRRRYSSFVLLLFVLLFVRGAAIGGLQISGIAQLAVLGVCELVLLGAIATFRAYSTFSIRTVSCIIRLTSLAVMVAFVPGVASDDMRSAMGYVLLALHGALLIFGFFAPAVYYLYTLYIRLWRRVPIPDVYGLRQLRRRAVSQTNLSHPILPRPANLETIDEHATGYPAPSRENDSRTAILRPEPSAVSSRYYRPPRAVSYSESTVSGQSKTSSAASRGSRATRRASPRDSRATSMTWTVPSEPASSVYSGSTRSSAARAKAKAPQPIARPAVSRPPPGAGRAEEIRGTERLGPRWDDYSFREADLFYAAPRRSASANAQPASPPPPPQRRSGSTTPSGSRLSQRSSAIERWLSTARILGIDSQEANAPAETGFHVVRPS